MPLGALCQAAKSLEGRLRTRGGASGGTASPSGPSTLARWPRNKPRASRGRCPELLGLRALGDAVQMGVLH